MVSRPLVAVFHLGLITVLFSVAVARAGDPLGDDLRPDPTLTPEQVVRIQLEALRRNDAADRGIAVAFRFASPDNRRMTGPEPRFGAMIKNGPYALMLNYDRALFAPIEVRGRDALQAVTLVSAGAAPVTYLFHLRRQEASGPLANCWMTEGVQVKPEQGRAA